MKSFKITILVIFLLLFFQVEVHGMRAVPEYVVKSKSKTINVKLAATNSQVAEGVQLRLTLTGGKILDYQITEQGLLFIGTCDEQGHTFTNQKVCVDIVAKNTIYQGDSLGTLKIKIDSQAQAAVLNSVEGNNYILKDPSWQINSKGKLGMYSTKQISQTELEQIKQQTHLLSINTDIITNQSSDSSKMPAYFVISTMVIIVLTISILVAIFRKNMNH